ncbi:MAG: Fur family transcriptional regulator [Clostridia bacterium]
MRKYSRQRELILEYLQNTTTHPTAEQIYTELKRSQPALSLSTVYRNVNLLADDGIIRRLDTGEGAERFDADLRPHNHFICLQCRQVTDVFRILVEPEMLEAALGESFLISRHTLYVYGLCSHCSHSEAAALH